MPTLRYSRLLVERGARGVIADWVAVSVINPKTAQQLRSFSCDWLGRRAVFQATLLVALERKTLPQAQQKCSVNSPLLEEASRRAAQEAETAAQALRFALSESVVQRLLSLPFDQSDGVCVIRAL